MKVLGDGTQPGRDLNDLMKEIRRSRASIHGKLPGAGTLSR